LGIAAGLVLWLALRTGATGRGLAGRDFLLLRTISNFTYEMVKNPG